MAILYKIGKHFYKGLQLGFGDFIVLNKETKIQEALGILPIVSSKYLPF